MCGVRLQPDLTKTGLSSPRGRIRNLQSTRPEKAVWWFRSSIHAAHVVDLRSADSFDGLGANESRATQMMRDALTATAVMLLSGVLSPQKPADPPPDPAFEV